MTALWFMEVVSPLGRCHPQICTTAPVTVARNGRHYLRKAEGLGPRLRAAPRAVAAQDAGLPFDRIAERYGAQATFRSRRTPV